MLENMRYLLALLILTSCSSPKEVVQGYKGKELHKMLDKIQGHDPQEVIKIMGTPAAYGLCKSCDKGIYKIIYLQRDMTKFYLGITYNTDAEVNCIVLDLKPNFKMRKYFFDRSGYSKQKNCNQRGGAITELHRILDEQEVAEKAEAEAAKQAKKKKK